MNRVTKASGASRIGASEEMGIINGKNLRRREGKLRLNTWNSGRVLTCFWNGVLNRGKSVAGEPSNDSFGASEEMSITVGEKMREDFSVVVLSSS